MDRREHTKGIYFAVTAFVIWGFVPMYFKAIEQVQPMEVVSHRVIWSTLFLGIILLYTGQFFRTLGIFRQPSLLFGLLLSALVIAVNWLVFIWAVGQGRILETTLGYFINPLINVVFGMIFFSERLRIPQWVALFLAIIGVVYQLLHVGEFPWVALTLALSFSIYGLLRKKLAVDAVGGLFIETLWLSPFALLFLFYLMQTGTLFLLHWDSTMFLLLALSGVVTSVPLLAFAAGARRINLSLIGFIQYIGPSIAFLIAVFYYGEPMDWQRLTTFIFIWCGLAIFTIDGYLRQRRCAQLLPDKAEC